MQSIFREYDIRGIFEKELNRDSVTKIGYFLGLRAKKLGRYAVVGYDARLHGLQLFEWLVSGLNASGMRVLNIGLTPTPVNYFACNNRFEGITPILGVQITGSHNPPEYNGFKITLDKAPFYGSEIYALGKEVAESNINIETNTAATNVDALGRYVEFLAKEFSALYKMDKKIAIDCGNGAAGVAIEPLFRALEIPFTPLFMEPDGNFPNHHPDPSEEENLEQLKELLHNCETTSKNPHEMLCSSGSDSVSSGASTVSNCAEKVVFRGGHEIGFAFDGDGDRVAVLTKENNIKGDILAVLFARRMQNPLIIGEVKCSQVMYDEIGKIGRAVMWKTGHSNLKVKVKELKADLAAEVSGHLFFNDRYFGYDDAIYAMLRVLELVIGGADLDSEIAALPKTFGTDEIKVKTTEDKKFKIIEKLNEMLQNPPSGFPKIREVITVDGLRVEFEHGFGLVRASNTTPVLVTRFEADNPSDAKLYEEKLNLLIQDASIEP